MGIWYNGGSIAVEGGSASIVGSTTLFATKVKEGDTLYIPGGELYQVVTITDDNNLTVDRNYDGTTDAAASYYILPTSPKWGEVSTVAHDLANFLANIATFFPTDGKPSDDEGGDGSFAIDPNSTPPMLYLKSSGAWDNGTSLGGPMGATGKGYGGTSTDTKTLANTGSMSFTTQTGLAWQTGSRIRVASASAPTTKWMEGVVTSYTSTTLIITIDKQGAGSGSASDWTFSSAGIPGEKGDTGATGSAGSTGTTGAPGAGYGGTSTTSRALGTGSMSFNIGTGKAYQIGDLVKAVVSTDSTKWLKGPVSDYTSGTLTINVTEFNGTGTFASWNIGLAGETGQQGIQGIQGDPGNDGADGSILTATSATSVAAGTGDKAFTLDAAANFLVNQRLRIASNSVPANFMSGLVKSYDSGTNALVVTVDLLGSSPDTATDWLISVTGEKGDQGPAGGFGSLLATKGNIPSADGTAFGAVSIGADGTVPIADATQPFGWSWKAEDAINAGPYWTTSDVASAATCDIGAATTPSVRITGSTTITSFGTSANKVRFVRFAASLILTYNGTSLVLPGSANIVTQAGDCGIFISDIDGNWRCLAWTPVGYIPRERLTADRTYYVRTDGNDTNNGLSNTSGGAFLTIQRAINVIIGNLDFGGFTITIQVGDGNYTAGAVIASPWTGGGQLIIQGNTSTKANCFISSAADHVFDIQATLPGRVTIKGFKLKTSGSSKGLVSHTGRGTVFVQNLECNGSGSGFYGMLKAGESGARLFINSDISITGGGSCFVQAGLGGAVQFSTQTVILVGTLAFSWTFAEADALGFMTVNNITWDISGATVTGSRYGVTNGAVINTGGGGASYFPGSSAGNGTNFGVSPWGQYI